MTSYAPFGDPTPFVAMTDDQVNQFQQANGLDDAAMQPIVAARAKFAQANAPADPSTPLAYRVGQTLRDGAGQVVDGLTAPFRPVIDAAKTGINLAGQAAHQIPNLVAGATGNPVVQEEAAAAAADGQAPTLSREEIEARARQTPPPSPQGGPGRAGGGGGPGGYGSILASQAQLDKDRAAESKDAVADMRDASRLQEDAIEQQKNIAIKEGEARGQILNQQLATQQKYDADVSAIQAQKQQVVNDGRAKIDQMKSDIRGASVDPNNWYKNRDGSTDYGRKVGAALAVAFGQLGASMTGGRNTALDIINSAMDKDIQAQADAIAGARHDIDTEESSLAQRRADFGDMETAKLAEKSRMLEHFATQVEQVTASTSNERANANAQQTLAAVRQQQAGIEDQIIQRNLAGAQQSIAARTSIQASRESNAIQREHLEVARLAAGAKSGQGQIPGLVGRPVDQQAITKAAEVKASADNMRSLVDEARKLYAEHGHESWGKVKERYDAIHTQLQLSAKELNKLGAISGTDASMMDKIVGNPNTWLKTNSDARLDSILDIINKGAKSSLSAYGYQEATDNALASANARPVQ